MLDPECGCLGLNLIREICKLVYLDSTSPCIKINDDLLFEGELANCVALYVQVHVPMGRFLATADTMLSCLFIAIPTATFCLA